MTKFANVGDPVPTVTKIGAMSYVPAVEIVKRPSDGVNVMPDALTLLAPVAPKKASPEAPAAIDVRSFVRVKLIY